VAQPKTYEKQEHEHLYLRLDSTSVAAQVTAPKRAHEKLKVTFDKEQGERPPPHPPPPLPLGSFFFH